MLLSRHTRRREFITLLGGAATWPVAAGAQQARTLPTIGFLGASTNANWTHWTGGFVGRLSELGWTDGRSVAIEYRWAEGRLVDLILAVIHRKQHRPAPATGFGSPEAGPKVSRHRDDQ
jgi:hypothetical protein